MRRTRSPWRRDAGRYGPDYGGDAKPFRDDGKDDSHRFFLGVFWAGVVSVIFWLALIVLVYAVLFGCAAVLWVG
jgi:hypothetical protein